jgi:hypothetical protein
LDEAHLVPAFVLTLRQLRRFIEIEGQKTAALFSAVFDRLPFWMTELCATPALPPPSDGLAFRLSPDDEDDPRLQDRLLAAQTRRVQIKWLATGDKPEEEIERAAADLDGKVEAVGVFVHVPKEATELQQD